MPEDARPEGLLDRIDRLARDRGRKKAQKRRPDEDLDLDRIG